MPRLAALPPRRASRRGGDAGLRAIGWVLTGALAALAAWRAVREPLAAPVPTHANAGLTPGQDFRDATYFPVRELLRGGGNPYDPQAMFAHWPVRQEFDLYAPVHLVLHAPLGLLPYRVALALYLLVILAALAAVGVLSLRAAGLRSGPLTGSLVATGVVLSQLGKPSVYLGQVNPLIALGSVLALTRCADRPRWAAAGLALAWIKPQYGIPLTVLLLARGTWRPAVFGTAAAATASLPVAVLLVVRSGGLGGFLDVVRRNLEYARSTPYAAIDNPEWGRVDVGAVLFRLTGLLPPAIELIVVVAVLGLAGWLVGGRAHRGRPFDVPELAVASTAVLICLIHQQGESLITLPAVLGVVAWWLTGRPGVAGPPFTMIGAAVLLCLPAGHVFGVASAITHLAGARADSLVDGLALLLAFAASCAVAARRRAGGGSPPAPKDACGTPSLVR